MESVSDFTFLASAFIFLALIAFTFIVKIALVQLASKPKRTKQTVIYKSEKHSGKPINNR